MKQKKSFEQFPRGFVTVWIVYSLLLYAIGAYILSKFGLIIMSLYLLYCFAIEINVLYRSCRSCSYYGKLCGFGKGWLCSTLFQKDDPKKFMQKEITFTALIPDFFVLIFPVVGGIIGLFYSFSFLCLGLIITLIILHLGGNSILRGSYACKYCKQRELGCPAIDLFEKKKK